MEFQSVPLVSSEDATDACTETAAVSKDALDHAEIKLQVDDC